MVSILWSGTSRRTRLAAVFLLALMLAAYLTFPTIREVDLPRVSIEYKQPPRSQYNESKVALLIENRPNPILAPLMLHFMSVVPPDWRFRFMGSTESVEHINQSVAIRQQVSAGKLDLTYIPSNMSTAGQEMISRFLTNLWLYETVLRPAEWLLVFQTDSILCANSRQNLDDYLEYDWVGAPWNPSGRFGGNGGLSLRRVSPMIDVLRQQVRLENSEPEDTWLADRLAHRPGAKMANGTVSLTFSGEAHSGTAVEIGKTPGADRLASYGSNLEAAAAGEYVKGIDDWREGFYEPMGYHTGSGGTDLHGGIWGTPEKRKHMWDYCPEVKMTLKMDAAKYIPGNCNPNWKRDGEQGPGYAGAGDLGYGTEVIDGVEYPILSPNLVPW
ncbi:hypothetical protein DL765_007653 [Monosporascus sp. GIB2]|nr:hypothetical protein DL765_007653 [Monosporascus sp. GIB2]